MNCVSGPDTNLVSINGTVSLEEGVEFEFGDLSQVRISLNYQAHEDSVPEVIYTELQEGITTFPFEYELPATIDLNQLNESPGEIFVETAVTYGPQARLLIGDLYGKTSIDQNMDSIDDIILELVEGCTGSDEKMCTNFKAGNFCGSLEWRLFVTDNFYQTNYFFNNFIYFESRPRLWFTDVPSQYDLVTDFAFTVSSSSYADHGIILEDCESILINLHGEEEVFSELPYIIDHIGRENLIFGKLKVNEEIAANYTPRGDEFLEITFFDYENEIVGDTITTVIVNDIYILPFSFQAYDSLINAAMPVYATAEIKSTSNDLVNGLTGVSIFQNPENWPNTQLVFEME